MKKNLFYPKAVIFSIGFVAFSCLSLRAAQVLVEDSVNPPIVEIQPVVESVQTLSLADAPLSISLPPLSPEQGKGLLAFLKNQNISYTITQEPHQTSSSSSRDSYPQISPGSRARVLSLDGGGTRAVVPLTILSELERLTGKPTYQLFDHIVATSAGTLIAVLLTVKDLGVYEQIKGVPDRPFSAQEALDAFKSLAPVIFGTKRSLFSSFGTKYDEGPFQALLLSLLGEKTLMDSETPLTFTAYDLTKHKLRVYSTFKERSRIQKETPQSEPIKPALLLRDCILSATAAPSYFLPSNTHHIDGGICLNNPSLLGTLYTHLYLNKRIEEQTLVSLGCGMNKDELTREEFGKLYLPQMASKITQFVFNGNPMGTLAKKLYKLHGAPYFRFHPPIPEALNEVDLCDTHKLDQLVALTRAYLEEEGNQQSIQSITTLIDYSISQIKNAEGAEQSE